MGEFDAFLAPEVAQLKGPPVAEKFLKGLESDFQPLASELIPYVVKYQPVYGVLFHIKHEGRHFLIRCLTLREFELLATLRRCFDPMLGLPGAGNQTSPVPIEDIFRGCILYPEEFPEDTPAGLPQSLVLAAIENSGWDSDQDILLVQNYGRNIVSTELITQMIIYISKAFPGLPQEEIYNSDMVKIMRLLAGAEAILKEKFEIGKPKQEKVGKKIARRVQIQEDLKELRKVEAPGPP